MAEERISQGITTEKELELNLSTESHKPWITAIGKALSSAVRIDILNLIKVHPLSLQEISRRLGIPLSSTALHIRCLEDAHLVSTESQPGIHGSMRVCMCDFISFHLEAYDTDISAAENTRWCSRSSARRICMAFSSAVFERPRMLPSVTSKK